MSQLLIPIKYYKPYFCFNCKKNSIELYNFNSKVLNYKWVLSDSFNVQKLKSPIGFFKCTNCGKVYRIKYNNKGQPIPIESDDYDLKSFEEDFIKYGIKEREKVSKYEISISEVN